ncbi:hypothetical protein QU38_02780, partial [Staphylococcus aureus]
HQGAERDREIIGIALLEAERTEHDLQHQLEEPGAGQRRRSDHGNRQGRGQRRIAGGGSMRRMGGGGRHGGPPASIIREGHGPAPCSIRVVSRENPAVEARDNPIRAG